MEFEVTIAGRRQRVQLRRGAGRLWEFRLDDELAEADVIEVAPGVFSVLLGGEAFELQVECDGESYRVHHRGRELTAEVIDRRRWSQRRRGAGVESAGPKQVQAPMPGKVIAVLVAVGDRVEAGRGLVVVEAMKMQNEIPAPKSGVVKQVQVAAGDTVEHGQTLVVVS